MWTTGTPLGAAPWPTFKRTCPAPAARCPPNTAASRFRCRRPSACASASSGSPGDAAVVNLTPVEADNNGYGLLVSSDVTPHRSRPTSTTRPATIDPNVAVAPIGADGKVCYVNSPLADRRPRRRPPRHHPRQRLRPRRPERRTRPQGRHPHRSRRRTHPALRPVCFAVSAHPATQPSSTSPPSTPTTAATAYSCRPASTAPFASNVNYAPGTIDPNVAVAPIGADGQVCYINSPLASVDLVADHLGTIRGNAYVPAVPERRTRPQGRHPHRPRRRTHPAVRPGVLRRSRLAR